MSTYTPEQLNKILQNHKKWVASEYKEGSRANLEGANLKGINLERAYLERVKLMNANLRDANLKEASMGEASLQHANLTNANLAGADLRKANLGCASLEGANLEGANLKGALIAGANLTGIKGKTIFTFSCNQHFGYFCDGIFSISCKTNSFDGWVESYQEIANEYNYSEQDIENYKAIFYFIKNQFCSKEHQGAA